MTLITDNAIKNDKAMKTTHNTQHTALNAKEYATPQITIVEFKVEHGFTSYKTYLGQTQSRHWDADTYSTGSEEISDCTNSSGNFSTGGWR